MNRILDFLVRFMNDTHLDDHVEMIHETDSAGDVTRIVIKKVVYLDDDDEGLFYE